MEIEWSMNSNTASVAKPGVATRGPRTVTLRWQMLLLLVLAWGFLNLAVGFYGGATLPPQASLPSRLAGLAYAVLGAPAQSESPIDYSLLREATTILQRQFVRPLPRSEELNNAAIKGIVALLDDPYTYWLSPDSARLATESHEGRFGGIGARVEWDETRAAVRILEVFSGSPAQAAALQIGDLITRVDGEAVSELGMTATIVKVRGPVDTPVELQVRRDSEVFDVVLTRAIIETEVLDYRMLGPGNSIGYLRFYSFINGSGDQMVEALEEMQAAGMAGLILDLRGNSGGFLTEAVQVAGIFGGPQLVVTQRARDGTVQEHVSEQAALVPADMPIAVVVDSDSASASELVAGAIQDWELGPLVGEATFGKGSAQTRHPLSDRSELRVTTSLWYTPLNRTIQDVGLEPDIPVAAVTTELETGVDAPLDVALEYILSELE